MAEQHSGTFGAPPAGAPHEVTQPLSQDTIARQLEQARANERPLEPFNPPASPVPPQPRTESAAENSNAATQLLAQARQQSAHPAASETDSPSRGIPRPIDDPGKIITGGFGSAGEAQYYPINGDELRDLTRVLLDKLNTRIENDIRFSMALTYKRLDVVLKLEVRAYPDDGFDVKYVTAPKDQSPEALADDLANEAVFVVKETFREFDRDGNPENPPDRMREIAGLPVPRKQMVQAGAIKQLVDIVPPALPGDVL